MFSGAQISLYPMSDGFVGIILGALQALDPYRSDFRIETDDVSTLIVGPPNPWHGGRSLVVAGGGLTVGPPTGRIEPGPRRMRNPV